MTNTELSALESLAKAAAPGPWHNRKGYKIYDEGNAHVASAWEEYSLKDGIRDITGSEAKANAAYIAAANPAAILKLIAELRQVKAELDWLASRFLKGATCPSAEAWRKCDLDDNVDCKSCWIKAAKEATCQK